jgi:hypothetical protein
LLLGIAGAYAQGPGGGGRQMPPGESVVGKVTAVNKDSLVVTPMAGGDPVTIKISGDTRIMKQRQPIDLKEIRVDDTVFARGDLKNNTMQAAVVGVVNPEMLQRMQERGIGGAMQPFNREDLGKKFILGEVKAVNETKLTIARPDNQTQEIEVDENTSFKRGQESITLPDIKAGDFVRGPGEVKNGVFVAKELIVGRPRMMMMRPEGQGSGDQANPQKTPDAGQTPPASPPK